MALNSDMRVCAQVQIPVCPEPPLVFSHELLGGLRTIVLLSPHPTPLATPPNYTGKLLEQNTSVQQYLEHKNMLVSPFLRGETSRYREQDLIAPLLHGSESVRAATCVTKTRSFLF
jgi:hypothetical protein